MVEEIVLLKDNDFGTLFGCFIGSCQSDRTAANDDNIVDFVCHVEGILKRLFSV